MAVRSVNCNIFNCCFLFFLLQYTIEKTILQVLKFTRNIKITNLQTFVHIFKHCTRISSLRFLTWKIHRQLSKANKIFRREIRAVYAMLGKVGIHSTYICELSCVLSTLILFVYTPELHTYVLVRISRSRYRVLCNLLRFRRKTFSFCKKKYIIRVFSPLLSDWREKERYEDSRHCRSSRHSRYIDSN